MKLGVIFFKLQKNNCNYFAIKLFKHVKFRKKFKLGNFDKEDLFRQYIFIFTTER